MKPEAPVTKHFIGCALEQAETLSPFLRVASPVKNCGNNQGIALKFVKDGKWKAPHQVTVESSPNAKISCRIHRNFREGVIASSQELRAEARLALIIPGDTVEHFFGSFGGKLDPHSILQADLLLQSFPVD